MGMDCERLIRVTRVAQKVMEDVNPVDAPLTMTTKIPGFVRELLESIKAECRVTMSDVVRVGTLLLLCALGVVESRRCRDLVAEVLGGEAWMQERSYTA